MDQLSEIKVHGKKYDTSDQEDNKCISEAPRASYSKNVLTLRATDLEDTPMCRICYTGSGRGKLLKPCECKGTIKYVHRNCLERWLESRSNQETCELCNHHYSTKRTRKSLWEWCRHPESRRDRRNLADDCVIHLFVFLLTTSVCIAILWLMSGGSTPTPMAFVVVAVFGVLVCVMRIAVDTSHHLMIFFRWRNRNYNVRIVDRQSESSSISVA